MKTVKNLNVLDDKFKNIVEILGSASIYKELFYFCWKYSSKDLLTHKINNNKRWKKIIGVKGTVRVIFATYCLFV